MLSYRHSFHAGNFADVLKHLTLQRILNYLTQKSKPLVYVDSHAGAGGYQLTSAEAQKTAEYQQGIGRLWQRDDLPELLAEYCQLVMQFNNQQPQLRRYPGSPWIAAQCLREQDKLFLHELHPKDSQTLTELFRKDRRCKVIAADGFKGSLGFFPPTSRRGLLLIDPSYEIKDDYQKVVTLISEAHKRFATGCIALWYPVVDRYRINQLEKQLQDSGIQNIQLFELGQRHDNNHFGMTSSGMIVVNPPWTLKADLESTLPWLSHELGMTGEGYYRSEQLVAE
ncbi:23S rRNA (adenine(2030)-N(6))-methyltransferase RlmJ [Celerinatantimonas sp. YJH-8]|uniref:23S rRNA (adenine(2030)-N(6))-methyltransferase RlmJ n=1 Tax=Celerinatantimonas sp. YJH-8 TaxID=3228714 RepID=UPI0038BFB994